MRDIKFRGISVERLVGDNQWLEGFGVDFCEMTDGTTEVYLYTNFNGVCRVIPETVGQYTGLRDREGEDIYEDYILDGSYKNPMSGEMVKRHYKVTYKKGGFYAEMIGHHPFGTTLLYFENENAVVIGNIHDNPELLQPQGE
ncbi:YopX family protein [Paenibacillus sp. MZ03-122A]|uniref:YopX family protein n=1 Tax=Paenibacillus sp. MZ03-122A TaxID=2962033 RepID=UPI0020B7F748|nr:YopX family protein [Paenibacillus sp. MZ03-122A]MCP3778782.1 YopX family protein [Paenibacillus sp. MZ03-122A]